MPRLNSWIRNSILISSQKSHKKIGNLRPEEAVFSEKAF